MSGTARRKHGTPKVADPKLTQGGSQAQRAAKARKIAARQLSKADFLQGGLRKNERLRKKDIQKAAELREIAARQIQRAESLEQLATDPAPRRATIDTPRHEWIGDHWRPVKAGSKKKRLRRSVRTVSGGLPSLGRRRK